MMRPEGAPARDFDAQLFRWMLAQVRPYWQMATVALLSLLAFAIIDTVMINLLRRAVDESLAPVGRFAALPPEARYANLVGIARLFGGLGVVSFGLRTCRATCWRCSVSESCGTCGARCSTSFSGSRWVISTAIRWAVC